MNKFPQFKQLEVAKQLLTVEHFWALLVKHMAQVLG